MSIMQRIKDIEDEMAKTQKNKATMGHLGSLKPPPAVSPCSEPLACGAYLVQMLDLPGIIEGAKDGKGRGRQ
ncbi:uncharacterized protein HaLaN_29872, partial [Haematococcus lacustris]